MPSSPPSPDPPQVGRLRRGLVLLAVLGALNLGVFWYRAADAAAPRASLSLDGDWDGPQGPQRIPHDGAVAERPQLACARTVTVPAGWRDRGRVLLRFERACHWLRVSWNGAPVGEHFGVRTAATFDVTPWVRFGAENRVEIALDSAWTGHPWAGVASTDPQVVQGYVSDRGRSRYAAVYGPVTLSLEPLLSVGPVRVLPSLREHRLRVVAAVRNGSDSPVHLEVRASVEGADLSLPPRTLDLEAGGVGEADMEAPWRDPVPWGPLGYGRPFLYTLRVGLVEGGREVDRTTTRFGVRDVGVEAGRLRLNGKPLFVRAFQIDPAQYPFTEVASARLAVAALRARGYNAVEAHEERAMPALCEAADESGMLVISGSVCLGHMFGPGRPHLPPAAAEALVASSGDALLEEQPHPSVIMWHPCALVPPLRDAMYARSDQVDPTRLMPCRGYVSEVVNMRPRELPAARPEGAQPVFIDELYPAEGLDRYVGALQDDPRVMGFVVCGAADAWSRGPDGRPAPVAPAVGDAADGS